MKPFSSSSSSSSSSCYLLCYQIVSSTVVVVSICHDFVSIVRSYNSYKTKLQDTHRMEMWKSECKVKGFS